MTELPTPELPTRMGLLPDTVAAHALTPGFLRGNDAIPVSALKSGTVPLDDDPRWDVARLRQLFEDAMRLHGAERPAACDAWLAPRLHYVLRLTRAEATRASMWNFIALRVAPDYVRWRWGKRAADGRHEVAQSTRFSGRWDLQCFSRLWWAAELFRDGRDYGPAVDACRNQDMLNTTLRLEMIQHRPTAQALVALLRRNVVRTGRDVNGLVRAVGTAGSTVVYEGVAPDDPRDYDALQEWMDTVEDAIEYSETSLPEGPDDGRVPRESVETLDKQFELLFATAPVRGKREDPAAQDDTTARGVSLDKPYVTQ